MTTYVMHREVCLKHRKNRRETIPAGVSFLKLTAVFVLFVVIAARVRTVRSPRRSFAVIVQEQDA